MVKKLLIKYSPWMGAYKRYLVALKDHLGTVKESYSQQGEDQFICNLFRDQQVDLSHTIYVDIGANHPTDISNTYLLYRHGHHGVLIEANSQLCRLLRQFRKRDIVLNIGAGNKALMGRFNISKTPVRSSFLERPEQGCGNYRTDYVAIMRPEDAINSIGLKYNFISLLSIDVEGMDFEVLDGCQSLLPNTLLLCIEKDTESDIGRYSSLLPGFTFLCVVGCNAFFKNNALKINRLFC